VRAEENSKRRDTRALTRFAPRLPALLHYSFAADFRHDLVAGVSVAAVALPVAVAYAELAGFSPVVGLYSCILPLVAYAVFGTSRQLMVNPDAATCAMVAAAIAPLAAGNQETYWSLSVTLAFITGLFCIGASFLRLGALADFLSKPILVGFLNGVAISILLGQIGKVFGFPIETAGILPRLWEFVSKLPQTHWPTLAVGLVALGVMAGCRRFFAMLPAALVTMVVTGLAVALLDLEGQGVAVVGNVPAGLPPLRVPTFPLEHLPTLVANAAGLALVLFSSGMLTARSFAEKNRYHIDVDREFAAFGAANIASALSQGFAVTGADSRTAMVWSHSDDGCHRRRHHCCRITFLHRTAALCAGRRARRGSRIRFIFPFRYWHAAPDLAGGQAGGGTLSADDAGRSSGGCYQRYSAGSDTGARAFCADHRAAP